MYKSLILNLNNSNNLLNTNLLNIKFKYKTKKFIKLYTKKKPTLFKPIRLELKLFYNKIKNSLYGNNFHGQFNIKKKHNTLPHLENSYNKFIRYFIRNGLGLKARSIINKSVYNFSKILISKSQKHIKSLPLSNRNQLNFLYFSSFSKNANNLFN